MKPFYVVGGVQKEGAVHRKEWSSHEKAMIVCIDPDREQGRVCLEYVSPPEVIPDSEVNHLFKAATFLEDRCYLCTSTEVLEFSFPGFELRRRISHPCFNDLHHVHLAANGHLFVANTGLDMVVEMDGDGEILRMWNTLGDPNPWGRFSPDVDYRKVPTTKPHQSHPNFVFTVDDQVWVTRCHQKDAICLTHPDRRIPVDVERPHDGLVIDDRVYFTTVDGHVVVANWKTLRVEHVFDLNKMQTSLRWLGWCRGLAVLDEDHLLVGFTRLRPTKWKANLAWLKHGIRDLYALMHQPAHVSLFDVRRGEKVWGFALDRVGLSTVFSIHWAPGEAASLREAA